jgi:hypothetical protein
MQYERQPGIQNGFRGVLCFSLKPHVPFAKQGGLWVCIRYSLLALHGSAEAHVPCQIPIESLETLWRVEWLCCFDWTAFVTKHAIMSAGILEKEDSSGIMLSSRMYLNGLLSGIRRDEPWAFP